jgi:hypothetical protein
VVIVTTGLHLVSGMPAGAVIASTARLIEGSRMRDASRRTLHRSTVASVLVAVVLAVGAGPAAAAPAPEGEGAWFTSPDGGTDYAHSATLAYRFLDGRVDEYCSDDGMCLPRSYQGGFFTTPDWDFTSSFLYDDALIIMAYAARGFPDDIRRARSIGDAMLFVQQHDPAYDDGRTRASYEPAALRDGRVEVAGPGAFTGNQAWVGMALARLYDVTGEQQYLDGALRLGQWIQGNTADTDREPFGYTGGQDDDGKPFLFKSTEHNIDVAGFFTQLADLTGDAVWAERATMAAGFVAAMQHEDGHLSTGTHIDGSTINPDPIPEDPQTWSSLATRDDRYGSALDWTIDNLHAVDGPYQGPSFSDRDVSKVWFEGSGHLALALRLQGDPADAAHVDTILSSIELAQRQSPNGDGKGIVATSADGLDSGFGDKYYASLHTGATAWYLLAITGANPFRLAEDDGAPTAIAADDGSAEGAALAETGTFVPWVAGAVALVASVVGAVLLRRRHRRG